MLCNLITLRNSSLQNLHQDKSYFSIAFIPISLPEQPKLSIRYVNSGFHEALAQDSDQASIHPFGLGDMSDKPVPGASDDKSLILKLEAKVIQRS